MDYIQDVLAYLGPPYHTSIRDHEPVILRSLDHFEFEISGLHQAKMNCILYIWMTHPHQELMGIYSGIKSKEDLKDLLGYCSIKYQNVLSRIQVEREDPIR